MTWTGKFGMALGLMAFAATAQGQPPEAISGQSIDKPQRSTDPIGFYRANDVVGMTVRGADGEDLGKIQDIVIDSRSSEVQYFLLKPASTVKVDGVLVMPWTFVTREYQAQPQVQHITVDLPRERLLKAPVIRRSGRRSWQNNAPIQVFRQVDRFYSVTRNVLKPNLDRREGRRGRRNRQDGDRSRRMERRENRQDRADRTDRDRQQPDADTEPSEAADRPDRSDNDRPQARTEADAEARTDATARPDSDAKADADATVDADAEVGGDANADADLEADSETQTETAPQPGSNANAESDAAVKATDDPAPADEPSDE